MSSADGLRVLVTRAREDNASWAVRLRALGAEVVELACIECETLPDVTCAPGDADWIAFTSRRGVDAFAELTGALPERARVACVSEATAARARERLGRCDFVAAGGTARALGEELAAAHPPASVLLVLAQDARDALAEALEAAGWSSNRIDVYHTRPAAPRAPKPEVEADVVLLASPSAVTGLTNLATLAPDARVVTIGPTTTAAARAAGLVVAAEAETRDLDGMLRALETIPTEAFPTEKGSTT